MLVNVFVTSVPASKIDKFDIQIVALKNTNTGTPEKVSSEAEASIKNLSSGSTEMSKAVDDASQKLSNEEIPFQVSDHAL